MKLIQVVRWLSTLVVAVLSLARPASAADIHVMISAGFYHVYAELGPAFEKASGHHLITVRGPSMGDSPESIPTRLSRGEAADVVILDGHGADELVKRGVARADGKTELAISQIGMVVKEGAAKPDIGSSEAFKQAMLKANSVGYTQGGATGAYLKTLFEKLGIAEALKPKLKLLQGGVGEAVTNGEIEIGMTQISEILPHPGAELAGPLPSDI